MTINERIISAVTPVVSVCVPDLLKLDAGETGPEEYCTFDYKLSAGITGDDAAEELVAQVRLRYFAPLKAPTTGTREALFAAIADCESFSIPQVENATDEIGQAYVFSFDALADGDENG